MRDEIVKTLRDEARFRPTIWGDARPLLMAAADEIEQMQTALGRIVNWKNDPQHWQDIAAAALKE